MSAAGQVNVRVRVEYLLPPLIWVQAGADEPAPADLSAATGRVADLLGVADSAVQVEPIVEFRGPAGAAAAVLRAVADQLDPPAALQAEVDRARRVGRAVWATGVHGHLPGITAGEPGHHDGVQ